MEPDARTIACNKLKTELEELKVMLSNERTEFQNAIADLKEMGDKTSTAVVESVTVGVPTSVEHCVEEVCKDYVEDCIEACGAEVATCESFYIGEKSLGRRNIATIQEKTLYGMPMSFHLCLKIPLFC